eukprot:TRINITY_DN64184_c0_g1_i1.p1 TRINITY_DN64184_c0_g1~~TRINITY_DN64184_c0_g1_i1.p1  ORF type:complete len:627 (-),score=124.52 TRINITY_DN64184_c0_g1_i1:126-2006(-)
MDQEEPRRARRPPTKRFTHNSLASDSWYTCVVDNDDPNNETTVGYQDERRLLATQMFAGRSYSFLEAMKPLLQFRYFEAGSVMITEGDVGDFIYIILAGCVEVSVGGILVARLCDGAVIGEIALLNIGISRGKRVATVRCISSCAVVAISASDFGRVMALFPGERGRLAGDATRRMGQITRLLRWTSGEGWSAGRMKLRDVKPTTQLELLGMKGMANNTKGKNSKFIKLDPLEKTYQAFHNMCLTAKSSGASGKAAYSITFNKQAADAGVTAFGLSGEGNEPKAKRKHALKPILDEKTLGEERLCPQAHSDFLLDKVYRKGCEQAGVKANSAACKIIADSQPCFCSLQTVDLANLFIGDRGLPCLLPVLRCARPGCLRILCLAGNGIHTSSLQQLVDLLSERVSKKDQADHSTLAVLDLSFNPIPGSCTPALVALLEKKPSLLLVGLQGTQLGEKRQMVYSKCLEKFDELEMDEMEETIDLTRECFYDQELLTRLKCHVEEAKEAVKEADLPDAAKKKLQEKRRMSFFSVVDAAIRSKLKKAGTVVAEPVKPKRRTTWRDAGKAIIRQRREEEEDDSSDEDSWEFGEGSTYLDENSPYRADQFDSVMSTPMSPGAPSVRFSSEASP